MMKLAFDGITSFSYKPLVIAGYFGGLSFFIGLISIVITMVKSILNKTEIINFEMIISINLIMFGITLGCIGIMGQYTGRIFDESKGRPIYIIASTINYTHIKKARSAIKNNSPIKKAPTAIKNISPIKKARTAEKVRSTTKNFLSVTTNKV